ncbi:MAG: hypothetical protein MMC33_009125 [Icmadophila ericetorum]|nr:hypothetical protein [Icmadophila ericetorum]
MERPLTRLLSPLSHSHPHSSILRLSIPKRLPRQSNNHSTFPKLPKASPSFFHHHRNSSTITPKGQVTQPHKPRVLEKPSKFTPPSHGARRVQPRQYPGAPLSEHERSAMQTKQYPHMMPPEGSFMRWFLTNRSIHLWITMGTLSSLAVYTLLMNFLTTSPVKDLIPSKSLFLQHPFAYMSQCWSVYRLHVEKTSEEAAERRRKKLEDVRKRNAYKKAHALDGGDGKWKVRSEGEGLIMEGEGAAGGAGAEGVVDGAVGAPAGGENGYTDFEGKRRPVKKWLGIW